MENEMNWIPMGDRLVLKEVVKDRTASGLYLPGSSDVIQATVVAVGHGVYTQTGNLIPTSVRTGDLVWVSAGVGEKVTIDGNSYIICREMEVLLRSRNENN